ncbi:MAG: hypothetical protein H6887_02460 [Hoeflea sp.]|nr:hypothetical protein [Hoeflea sp.]
MWLGTGVYFFQEGYDLCHAWAMKACQRASANPGDTPAVLHAKINTQFGIDLISNTHWPLLRAVYDVHKEEYRNHHQNGIDTLIRPMTPQETSLDYDHPLDHSIIDTLVDVEALYRRRRQLPEPTLVRAAFVEGQAVDRRSWLFDAAAVIVSVIDHECIESLEVVF